MNERTRKKFRRVRDLYAFGDFYTQRGLGLLTAPYTIVKYTSLLALLIEFVNRSFKFDMWGILTVKNVLLLTPFLIVGGFLMGYWDAKKIHLLQKTNEIGTRYNPILNKLEKRVKRIDKRTRNRVIFH